MAAIRIVGVDPGSRLTGYGVIEVSGPRSRWLGHGRIRCEQGEMPARLLRIFRELSAVLREYAPSEAAVESVFVNRNVSSALVLGQARGAALCALAEAGLPVAEYAPAQVKSAIVGQGRAEKAQVQHMVRVLLSLERAPEPDAADALAVALCHAHLRSSAGRPAGRPGSPRSDWALRVAELAARGKP